MNVKLTAFLTLLTTASTCWAFVRDKPVLPLAPRLQATPASEPEEKKIGCPLFHQHYYRPDTSSGFGKFMNDCQDAGLARKGANVIAAIAVWQQKGFWRVLRRDAPAEYRLDEVPLLNHPDLFGKYPDEVKQKLQAAANENGKVHAQTLVDIKKWIAMQEKTAQLFLGSGGNLETGMVYAEDVLRLLSGTPPREKPEMMTARRIKKAATLSTWD